MTIEAAKKVCTELGASCACITHKNAQGGTTASFWFKTPAGCAPSKTHPDSAWDTYAKEPQIETSQSKCAPHSTDRIQGRAIFFGPNLLT